MDFLRAFPPRKQKGSGSIEATLGTVVVSWLGALTVLGGVVFFLQYAFSSGLAFLHPMARVLLAIAAGMAMVGTGQWFHYRRLRHLSAALSGAGIAVVIAAVLAAHVAFEPAVLSQSAAFFLVPVVGVIGVGLGMLNRSQAVVLVSIAGMYIAPCWLQNRTDQSEPLLVYLLVLSAGALVLVQLKPKWESLRVLAYAGAWIWLLTWCNSGLAKSNGMLGIVFISAFFLMFLGEMSVWLVRALKRKPSVAPVGASGSFFRAEAALPEYAEAVVSIISFINTGFAMCAAACLFQRAGLNGLWGFTFGVAAVMIALACVIPSPTFQISANIQAIVLVILTAPLYFQNNGTIFAYALLALGFGIYANRANSRFGRAWMFTLLLLVAYRLFAVDSTDPLLQERVLTLGSHPINVWAILGWCTAVIALLLAWLSRPSKAHRADGTTQFMGASWAAIGCVAVGTAVSLAVSIYTLGANDASTVAAAVWIFVLIALMRGGMFVEIASALESLTIALLLALSIKWLVSDGIGAEVSLLQDKRLPFLNFFTLNALLIAGAVVALRPMGEMARAGRVLSGWWLTALGFVLVNMQAFRVIDNMVRLQWTWPDMGDSTLVKNVAMTFVWGGTALTLIAVGFRRRNPSIRYVALSLFGCTVAKILFVDMANAQTALRVLSFLAVGVLLLVVSYLYHRVPQAAGRVAGE